ncbi:MAG: hypothetical protein OXF02_01970 [Simkaniaceae bacterium]|nr:hypothetical protein [Simkaniaceae bacterium]
MSVYSLFRKRVMRILLFLVALLLRALSGPLPAREIVVRLRTENRNLIPLYVSSNGDEIKQNVLFGLRLNGMIVAESDSKDTENLLRKTPFPHELLWQRGYRYVVRIVSSGKEVHSTLFALDTRQVHILPPRPATRPGAHEIADALYERLSGKKGIARRKICYALQTEKKGLRKSEIWTADCDGRNARRVSPGEGYRIHPVPIPPGTLSDTDEYLYVDYRAGQAKIHRGAFDGSREKPLLSLRGNQMLPALSSSGTRLAFISDATGRADLFLQTFDPRRGPVGKPVQLYSFPGSVQASPTFSPDGNRLVFVSDKGGSPALFLLNIPPGSRRKRPRPIRLTYDFRENICPAWSPDGTKLAYSAKIDGVRQIMMYDFATQREIPLTRGAHHKENPCWSPEGEHILFNTASPASSELFVMHIGHRSPVRITGGPGRKHYPAWR